MGDVFSKLSVSMRYEKVALKNNWVIHHNYFIIMRLLKLYKKGVAEEEHGPALALSAGKLSCECH